MWIADKEQREERGSRALSPETDDREILEIQPDLRSKISFSANELKHDKEVLILEPVKPRSTAGRHQSSTDQTARGTWGNYQESLRPCHVENTTEAGPNQTRSDF